MKYARPPFPPELYKRLVAAAETLGYTVRGQKWKLLEFMIDYAAEHPNLFRKR